MRTELLALSLSLVTAPAFAFIADGRLGAGEAAEYTSHFTLDFVTEDNQTGVGGELWLGTNASNGNAILLFSQPKDLVDNSYGANSIGWGGAAPSGKSHSFTDLLNSDKLGLVFSESGTEVLNVVVDYLSADSGSSSGFTAGPVSATTGSAASVEAVGTSLASNLADSAMQVAAGSKGINLTTDSPPNASAGQPADYSDIDPAFANWIFNVNYEVEIDKAVFEPGGFTSANVALGVVHDSPNKLGKNKVFFSCGAISAFPTKPDGKPDKHATSTLDPALCGDTSSPPGSVPEPATLPLLALGALSMFVVRRRRAAALTRA